MFTNLRVLLLSLLVAVPAAATPPGPGWLRDGRQAFETLVAGHAAEFEAMDQAFIDAQASRPEDVALAVAHCDFFWHVWDLEGSEWADVAPGRHEACLASLEERMPDAPEVLVLLAEQDSSEERERAALARWDNTSDWPPVLRIRLGKVLAESEHIGSRAADVAIETVRLGDASSLPLAVRRLAALEGPQAAAELAAAAPLATSTWQLDQRLKSLAALDHPTAARDDLVRHLDARVSPSWTVAADVLVAADDLDTLEDMLKTSKDDADDTRPARLSLALARGDAGAAVSHFELDMDKVDATGRDYFRILAVNPLMAFAPTLLPFALVMLLIGALLLLLPLPLLLPVHYRGLARRLANRAPQPLLPGLGLRHAWYGTAVGLLLAPTAILIVAVPEAMAALFEGDDAMMSTLTVMLWSTVAGLLALLPTLYWLRWPQWTVPRGQWPGMGARVLLAYGMGYLVALACVVVQGWMTSSGMDVGTSTFHTSILSEGMARYGLLVTVIVMAVLVPVFEEWVFRGLLLGGLAKHIHFGWANLAQAMLFMAIHDDVARFPFYLALGLLAGWLVKRYRSLLPAVLLHVLNNSIACWLMLS